MTEQQPPKIEFPCPDYAIKVIGRSGPGFQDLVIEIMQKHVSDFDVATLSEQPSRNGKFVSVRVRITATGVNQLRAIHADLMATGRVQMVI